MSKSTKQKVNPIVRILPSLTDLTFLMPIGFTFAVMKGTRTLLGDGDTGWHIRTGEWIIQNGRVPDADLFSFTKPGAPWFAWEWLWDVLFGWMHMHSGLAPVALLSLLVLCVTYALAYRLGRRMSGNAVVAFTATQVGAFAGSMHWLARPHLFTLLFTVVFLTILESVREGRTRMLLWLAPLTVLWTNLHGGFFVGILVISCYALGELVTWLTDKDADVRQAALSRSKPYLLAAGACMAASFLNPYTYKLHLHIYSYLTEPFHLENVSEFLSPVFHTRATFVIELLLGSAAVSACWFAYRKQFGYTILLFSWIHFSLVAVRNIPIMGILGAPLIARAFCEIGERLIASGAPWTKRVAGELGSLCGEITKIDRIERLYAPSIAGFVLLALVVYSPIASAEFRPEFDPEGYPAKVVAQLPNELADNVFTDDEWGDYLIYRLYPRIKVFVDGRSDFYGAHFEKQYVGLLKARYDWEEMLSRYGVKTVLLRTDCALTSTLKQTSRWTTIYDDGKAIVFRFADGSSPMRIAWRGPAQSSAGTAGGTSGDRQITNSTTVIHGSHNLKRGDKI